jgi:hypothetical protein
MKSLCNKVFVVCPRNRHPEMLDLTLTNAGCSQDGATVAKGQEISLLYRDAAALVQSMIEKISAGAPK